MLIEKLYFEWNRKLEQGPFKLDEYVRDEDIKKYLIKDSTGSDWYKIHSNENIKIILDENRRIKSKLFLRGSKVGKFEISWKFLKEVKEEFEKELKLCDREYKGDLLVLNFGDCYLGAAILILGNLEARL